MSDAIRWVLGEQSAKALRGGEMADVIFNGTDGRKPLGLAEVSLTIGGCDAEHLQAAGVEIIYDEVTLTRRVFRDGGSEYFINKTPCRLKDVQQLFMGTGVGRTSYSIMAQGNITQILSSKPDDRRLVFEEAAGITKFKTQKKETLRKLEQTDQNLLRVADLIREVKRQIGSLQRQAGKARRYKQLMLELQHLDTQLARHHFDLLQNEISERQSAVEKLRGEMEVCSENVLRGENEIGQLREGLSELEMQINQAQQRGLELKNEIERHESRIQFNEERLRELESHNARALGDIAQAEERHLAAETELSAVTEKLAASSAALEEHRKTLAEKRGALQALEKELQTNQENLRRIQADLFAAAQQLTRVRNEINALDLQKQGNIVRLEKLSAEKIQLEEERSHLENRLQEFSAHVEAEKLNVQFSRGTVEERQNRLREIALELNQVAQKLDELLREQAEKRSRLNVLEQLQESHEGFSPGALSALKTAQNVLGSLAHKIKVPDQYIVAIEAALGHNLQLILTEQPESAQIILADLSAKKKGRASIAALTLGSARGSRAVEAAGRDSSSSNSVGGPRALPEISTLPGISALAVIQADSFIESLLEQLLGQTLIISDLAAATKAWRETNGAFDFVTQTGELLNRHGIFTGGSSNNSGQAPASILGRKNQIADLQNAGAQIQEAVSEMSRHKGALLSEQTDLQASLQQAQTDLRTQEVAIATRQGEFNALQTSQRMLHQKIDTVVYEIKSLAAQEQEGLQKRESLMAQIGQFESQEGGLLEQIAALNSSLERLRQQRDNANVLLTETKVALATEEQLGAAFGQQKKPLEQRLQELSHLGEQRRQEIGSCLNRKTQAESEMAQSRQKIESLQHDRQQV
ncbi:MAG: chromosome segregation protein SMC, partial [Limisphaerales bacterium]